MAETAAHLVDQVIPRVPVRQWVLSFPIPLQILFAAQPEVLTPVLCIVHRVITGFLLEQAGLERGAAHTGSVTLIRRFGSAANLNIHLHCLVLDGVIGAPRASRRAAIVPDPVQKASEPAEEHAHGQSARMSWARLLKRVFDIDIERCKCGGRLKIIAAIEDPGVIVRILTHLGLPARAPPRAPARLAQLVHTDSSESATTVLRQHRLHRSDGVPATASKRAGVRRFGPMPSLNRHCERGFFASPRAIDRSKHCRYSGG